MLLKDAEHWIQKHLVFGGKHRGKRLLAHPHYPSRGATIFRIARLLGLEITNEPRGQFDLAIYWEYATHRQEWEVVESISDCQVINLNSRNIAKDFLDQSHQAVFGYGTAVDPLTHSGALVAKSTKNAVHDGRLLMGPLTSREEGLWYQRLVDSSQNESEVMDLRVPVIGNVIPHLYCAYRKKDARFVNVPYRVTLATDVNQWLSENEQALIVQLSHQLGIDFGEMDVLRDAHNKRIYVVDANNTPQGPPKHLSNAEKKLAMQSLAASFSKAYL